MYPIVDTVHVISVICLLIMELQGFVLFISFTGYCGTNIVSLVCTMGLLMCTFVHPSCFRFRVQSIASKTKPIPLSYPTPIPTRLHLSSRTPLHRILHFLCSAREKSNTKKPVHIIIFMSLVLMTNLLVLGVR